MDIMQRTIFFVSDGTGITAEALGHSLLSQFEGVQLREVRMPFVDTPEKIDACLARIGEARARDGARPIVVTTLVNQGMAQQLQQADANRALAARDLQVARARVALLPELPLSGAAGATATAPQAQPQVTPAPTQPSGSGQFRNAFQ